MDHAQIVKMGYAIQKYLEQTNRFDVTPPELMDLLIEQGYFKYDVREGKPLRDVLRKLDDDDMLYLLPQLRVDRMDVNRRWFFNAYRL
ncbi:MAG: hypothetical protein EOO48_05360 [Flavobacterium sp.]|nr:MAG: hypothetical protein EOO48_05360 [Flavobacterium sp.]